SVLDERSKVADDAMGASTMLHLLNRLGEIEQSTYLPDLADLATSIRPFVAGLAPTSKPDMHPHLARLIDIAGRVERILLPRFLHRILLIIGSLIVGLFSM